MKASNRSHTVGQFKILTVGDQGKAFRIPYSRIWAAVRGIGLFAEETLEESDHIDFVSCSGLDLNF